MFLGHKEIAVMIKKFIAAIAICGFVFTASVASTNAGVSVKNASPEVENERAPSAAMASPEHEDE